MRDQPRLEIWRCQDVAATLRGLVIGMFGHRLERLHEWPHLGMIPADVSRADDQGSRAHRQFYRKFPRIENYYRGVAFGLGQRALGPDRPFYIQRVPSFRLHFPRSRAVGEPHTDWQYGHQFGELNFWLPLTDARNTSTMWVAERAEGWDMAGYAKTLADEGAEAAFSTLPDPIRMWPVNLELGHVLVWDSVLRAHGNLLNHEGLTEWLEVDVGGDETRAVTTDEAAVLVELAGGAPLKCRRRWFEGTGHTRVSIDFRILPVDELEAETSRRSVNKAIPFTLDAPGRPGYWTDPRAVA